MTLRPFLALRFEKKVFSKIGVLLKIDEKLLCSIVPRKRVHKNDARPSYFEK
jgi:hypothetical protein